MIHSQKLELRRSEVRQRLSELAEADELTDEARGEADKLTGEWRDLETRHRAAIISEGEDEASRAERFEDTDGEYRELRSRANLASYLAAASVGNGITPGSPEDELNAALEVRSSGGGVAVPWTMLEAGRGPVEARETRVFTETSASDGSNLQRPILQRLFGPGLFDSLGVRLDSVPVGRSEWPLISGGVVPAMAKEGTAAAAAAAATFSHANLVPKRISGKYEYSHEVAAAVPGVEQALRRDLADAVKAEMSDLIVSGSAPNTQNPQRVQGFLTGTRLTTTDLSSAEATAADYGRLHSLAVDGVHAAMESEVTSVIGDETYRHSAGLYIAGSGEAGSGLLSRRSGGCMASAYIPDVVSTKQLSILHAAGPNGGGIMRGDSVAAMWPTLEIVRDIYSQASQGVTLTWVGLWDAHVALRPSAYKRIAIQIS